jgi:hypothetical protein
MNVDYFTKELDILILFDERHECRLLHERIRYFNSIWRKQIELILVFRQIELKYPILWCNDLRYLIPRCNKH